MRSLHAAFWLLTTLPALPALAEDRPAGLPVLDQPRPVISEIISLAVRDRASFVGTVAARTETDLGFPVIGTLASRPVDTGQRVARGETIAQLDPEDLEADVRAAEAGVAVATANLRSASDAQSRAAQLAGRGVDAETRLEDSNRALAAAQARLDQAQASLASAQEIRSYATLRAPQDGIITQVRFEPGATVAAGDTIVTLAASEGREVVIDLSEQDVASLEVGATFDAVLLSSPAVAAKATLTRIDPVAERTTRTRRLHLALADDAPAGFRLGSLAGVTPDYSTDAVFSLPSSAIIDPGDADNPPQVWLVDRSNDTVQRRSVALGEVFGTRTRVSEGLKVGDEVVLKGIHSLKDGQIVGPRVSLP
ncbi:efflux RND transporter periplasmic adaptor subunit [Puniceibacterium sp. IMCC21224]|uniref:efflux RND transporter periplasmic adaptor subunit n=1 Tax=Puniceibacterium sp. IMCC21224 TaxID=1618204 RepID=UPI00065D0A60|nr:efflux RND transporter periplasmic adaptor subunit [Puniceibacterium sp. IMCC21224]KMK65617.1 RND family efflux transporter, MFP subunit [Puniceibacterium sp. IMCC21224]